MITELVSCDNAMIGSVTRHRVNFVNAGPHRAYPSAIAQAFVDSAADVVRIALPTGQRSFSLTPFRLCGVEYLSFDWCDDAANTVNFTFYAWPPDARVRPLPFVVGSAGDDVSVCDITDALLLSRLIAERVNGCSIGRL